MDFELFVQLLFHLIQHVGSFSFTHEKTAVFSAARALKERAVDEARMPLEKMLRNGKSWGNHRDLLDKSTSIATWTIPLKNGIAARLQNACISHQPDISAIEKRKKIFNYWKATPKRTP